MAKLRHEKLIVVEGPEKMEMVASLGSVCGPQGRLICRVTGEDGKVRPVIFTTVDYCGSEAEKTIKALCVFDAIGHDVSDGWIFAVKGRMAYGVPKGAKLDDLNKLYLTDYFSGYYDAKTRKGVFNIDVVMFTSAPD